MAKISHYWAPHERQNGLFQATGQTHWWWELGDNQHYWGFSIRPHQANTRVEVLQQWTVSDNDLRQTEHFEVDVRSSGLLMFNAIKVEEP